jgi:hypothetical protein
VTRDAQFNQVMLDLRRRLRMCRAGEDLVDPLAWAYPLAGAGEIVGPMVLDLA